MSPRRGEATMVPDVEPRTYYDQPVLKAPVWHWEISAYLFTGGLAAGAALIAAAGDLTGDGDLATRMEQVALVATAASGALLAADLGRPSRFIHMLRVVKPSSPMNVGAWLLGAFASGVGTAVVADLVAPATTFVRLARLGAAAIAPAIASYTAVLLSDTAIPAWHEARAELPFLFVGGAAASAGAVAVLVAPDRAGTGARSFLVGGAAIEIVASRAIERRFGTGVVGRAYRDGHAGRLGRTAQLATGAGALLTVFGHRRRAPLVGGALLALAGALGERFAVMAAGGASARDPAAVVGPQRERLGS